MQEHSVANAIKELTIDTKRVIEDTISLVKIDSQNPGPQEGACTDWLYRRLGEMGLEVTRQAVQPGRDNLIVTIPGRGTSPRLVLSAHTDVVPAGPDWTVPPFEGRVQHGRIYGRGAARWRRGAGPDG
jgi:acetylornithine deacetylase/succinyl-diaminopimelate desuccinylase-like protein